MQTAGRISCGLGVFVIACVLQVSPDCQPGAADPYTPAKTGPGKSGPLGSMLIETMYATLACKEPKITATGACEIVDDHVSDGPGKYAPGAKCEIEISGPIGLEPIEAMLAHGDTIKFFSCETTACNTQVDQLSGYNSKKRLGNIIHAPLENKMKIVFEAGNDRAVAEGFTFKIHRCVSSQDLVQPT